MRTKGGVGRTYRFYGKEPLWPFGWSLGYTTFTVAMATNDASGASVGTSAVVGERDGVSGTLRGASAAATSVGAINTTAAALNNLVFNLRVANTGKVAGGKVVQAYVTPVAVEGGPSDGLPLQSLWAEEKVFLEAGTASSR
jgi:hypothetical protein